MRNALVVTVALLMNVFCCAAQNLVPNPSFEEYDDCPWSGSYFTEFVTYWYNPILTSPDYFNACDNINTNHYNGVPANMTGYQPARTGNAYAAIVLYTDSISTVNHDPREYIAVKLISPLESDTTYYVQFYVSLCQHPSFQLTAVADVSVYLSTDSVYDTISNNLPFTPQVTSDSNILLQDTLNWMQISGTYIAEGDEQFITIGNFLDNSHTHVLLNGPYPRQSYYYIDDVTVIKLSQYDPTSSNALVATNNRANIYPNPASDKLTVTNSFKHKSTLQIIDAIGRVVQSFTLEPNIHQAVLDVSNLPNGLYTIEIIDETLVSTRSKLVVLH